MKLWLSDRREKGVHFTSQENLWDWFIAPLLLQMLYSFFLHFPPFSCARFFSAETCAIDLKLQLTFENGISFHRNIVLLIWPRVTKLDPFELKMEHTTPICQKKWCRLAALCSDGMPVAAYRETTNNNSGTNTVSRLYSIQCKHTASLRKKM